MLLRSRHLFRKIHSSEVLLRSRHGLCKNIFRENKKEQVLDNLAEKMDKCLAVELGVPRYPPEKKEREKEENDSPWSL